ncbi:uncharacterized protein TM35_000054770 [Trypanosoma theileri]|uniref:Uncharacterized protein n=1 Tax=Trypanosoma theileri TaxID=67003 RepID=A0A1X0P4W8_9TRYP|nr:uncharacterized protein TM35_000054770 [Trypanosoma theileri]ORC91881.1 hypothetical protein TM35_000054770 [Trypanosoma theileri]
MPVRLLFFHNFTNKKKRNAPPHGRQRPKTRAQRAVPQTKAQTPPAHVENTNHDGKNQMARLALPKKNTRVGAQPRHTDKSGRTRGTAQPHQGGAAQRHRGHERPKEE